MRFVDSNIFLRFLVDDDKLKADACQRLFQKALEGVETLFTTDMVIAEIVWVLESYYELDKFDVRNKVEKILNTPNLDCPQKEIIINALAVYEERNIDFIDAYNAYFLKSLGVNELYSYDRHFDRIKGIKRLEPE